MPGHPGNSAELLGVVYLSQLIGTVNRSTACYTAMQLCTYIALKDLVHCTAYSKRLKVTMHLFAAHLSGGVCDFLKLCGFMAHARMPWCFGRP
jgi:hypothetical protein